MPLVAAKCTSGELPDPVFCQKCCGVLAQMAYYPGCVDEGVCILSAFADILFYEAEQEVERTVW